MTNLTYKVFIDDTAYTQTQLDRYQYERTLHVLHELKALGVDLRLDNQSLSHTDLNWLAPEVATKISYQARTTLGEKGMLQLFRDVEADAERRWKAYNQDYDPRQSHIGTTITEVSGIGFQETMSVINGSFDSNAALSVNPEHYIIIGDIHSGQRGMEAFGMFGEPVYVHGIASQTIPDGLPFERDSDYPMIVCGQFLLKSDDTPIHVGACHQVRPSATGFTLKSTFFCPGKAPQAIADGHKLHFATEIINSAKYAFMHQQ